MRKVFSYIILLCGAFVSLLSCTKDDGFSGESGWLSFSGLNLETTVNTVSRTIAEPTLIFRIIITDNVSGRVVATYDDHTTMPDKVELGAGVYAVTAINGDQTIELAFDAPVYSGSSIVSIAPGIVSSVRVTCALSNIKVDVSYSDKFKNSFVEYKTIITNGSGVSLEFTPNETRSAYVKDNGNLTYTLSVKNAQGSIYGDTKIYTELNGRDNLKLHFDIEDKTPEDDNLIFSVKVDQTVNEISQSFPMLLKKGEKPSIEGDNFDLNQPIQVAYGAVKTAVVNANSTLGFNNMYLRHHSNDLVSLGIPMLLDLMHMTPMQSEIIRNSGVIFNISGELNNNLTVDFSQLTSRLPKAEDVAMEHKLELLATDMQKQYIASDVTFYVVGTSLLVNNAVVSEVFTWNNEGLGETSAVLSGQWVTLERPESLTFAIMKPGSSQWENVSTDKLSFNDATKTITTNLSELKLKASYKYKLVSESEESGEVVFTTKYPSLYNLGLDDWYKDGKTWYPKANSSTSTIWSTGNPGLTYFIVGKESNTTPEDNIKNSGRGVKMVSWNDIMAVGFAAGNLFTGEFNMNISDAKASVKFGKPYTARPNRLKGYYRYSSTTINTGSSHIGEIDQCHIYISLEDWEGASSRPSSPKVIGYGELKDNRVMSALEKFTIDVNYNSTAQPTHVVIVATSSIYGGDFIGGAGSTLYVDDFELEFD